jgi:pSer/pThr/pTyr-binding forkhead associated (FHA) protein
MSSRNALNLAELYALALNHGRDAFLAEVPYPVLVPRAVRIGNIERGQTADETMHYIPTVEDELSLFDSPRVLFLRRTAALGDGEEISIGRTADTDLVLSDHSVSKLHAIFHRNKDKSWKIEDKASKNGSWIEDLRLIPGVPVEIKSKEELRFGRIHLRFLAPEDFYEVIIEAKAEVAHPG